MGSLANVLFFPVKNCIVRDIINDNIMSRRVKIEEQQDLVAEKAIVRVIVIVTAMIITMTMILVIVEAEQEMDT